jgi:hypothetical protein
MSVSPGADPATKSAEGEQDQHRSANRSGRARRIAYLGLGAGAVGLLAVGVVIGVLIDNHSTAATPVSPKPTGFATDRQSPSPTPSPNPSPTASTSPTVAPTAPPPQPIASGGGNSSTSTSGVPTGFPVPNDGDYIFTYTVTPTPSCDFSFLMVNTETNAQTWVDPTSDNSFTWPFEAVTRETSRSTPEYLVAGTYTPFVGNHDGVGSCRWTYTVTPAS